jgi:hypothetical protein
VRLKPLGHLSVFLKSLFAKQLRCSGRTYIKDSPRINPYLTVFRHSYRKLLFFAHVSGWVVRLHPVKQGKRGQREMAIFKFLWRFFSFILLVLAIVAGVVDSIESVASSAMVTTPFGVIWADVDAAGLALVKQWITTHIGDKMLQAMDGAVLQQPAFAVFLSLALLCWMAGYKRPSPAGRFAA